MRRVYHERCDVQEFTKDQFGDFTWTTVATNIPCEMTPLSSTEKVYGGSTLELVQYMWSAREDSAGIGMLGTYRIIWRGNVFNLDGRPEEHYLRGRLQHREAVVSLDVVASKEF